MAGRTVPGLAAALVLAGCAAAPPTMDVEVAGTAALHAAARIQELEPAPPAPSPTAEDPETVTVPRSLWERTQRDALAARAARRPDMNDRVALEAVTGGAVRWYTGGDIAEIVEPWSLGTPLKIFLNFPGPGELGFGFFLLGAQYDVPIKHSEMYWIARSVGGGFRLIVPYAAGANVYFQVAAAYTRWLGREDDRPTHPNFRLGTIFKPDGFGRVQPKDVEGSEFGVGMGATWYISDIFGLNTEVNFRHQEGTDNWAGQWLEWIGGVALRF